jgi:2-dehydro-3-deoxyphosphogluconate aldolase / (4S)-4-hydroxy-2-oxoglutarate aldolase
MSTNLTASDLKEIGLISILRAPEPVDFVAISRALADGGILAMEITLNTPGALSAIGAVRSAVGSALRVGAGTILDENDARAAVDAGAEFIVTPTLQPQTIALCNSEQVPVICGCLSPTEALTAHRAGADFIKIFPADTFGPEYIRAILAPLPFLNVVPTGGVTLKNLKTWFDTGCAAVAVGGGLIGKQVLMDRDWEELRTSAHQFARAMANIRDGD